MAPHAHPLRPPPAAYAPGAHPLLQLTFAARSHLLRYVFQALPAELRARSADPASFIRRTHGQTVVLREGMRAVKAKCAEGEGAAGGTHGGGDDDDDGDEAQAWEGAWASVMEGVMEQGAMEAGPRGWKLAGREVWVRERSRLAVLAAAAAAAPPLPVPVRAPGAPLPEPCGSSPGTPPMPHQQQQDPSADSDDETVVVADRGQQDQQPQAAPGRPGNWLGGRTFCVAAPGSAVARGMNDGVLEIVDGAEFKVGGEGVLWP
ncbi:MAG: hypothetical protein LQ340_006107 [Diploschistes diacapsis]|nr:MAG: hypothetical protein LQ340_006107 [Diploschistes diacapsis]